MLKDFNVGLIVASGQYGRMDHLFEMVFHAIPENSNRSCMLLPELRQFIFKISRTTTT